MNPILVINSGSSSLKMGVYVEERSDETPLVEATVEDIGPKASLQIRGRDGEKAQPSIAAQNQQEAFHAAFEALSAHMVGEPAAVGHRIVHGGPKLVEHQRITSEVVRELQAAVHFAPLHLPNSIALIQAVESRITAPQFACFDTVFHRDLPESAWHYPLPQRFVDAGVRRYGFHGLSCESILHQLKPDIPERVIVAHLGSGASVTAILAGKSVDTSMGLTPTGGIPMSTRTGDLDPGVLIFLLQTGQSDLQALERVLNSESGFVALCGMSGMKEIEAAAVKGSERARLCFEIFCRALAKQIGAYLTVLGGLDLLVFTGGIGEHSDEVRRSVCERLAWSGVRLQAGAKGPVISATESDSEVRVLASQEDVQIARHCRRLLRQRTPAK